MDLLDVQTRMGRILLKQPIRLACLSSDMGRQSRKTSPGIAG
jgi:hypothetical protein